LLTGIGSSGRPREYRGARIVPGKGTLTGSQQVRDTGRGLEGGSLTGSRVLSVDVYRMNCPEKTSATLAKTPKSG
jgi:hypothetical protein